jgi:hypothetical protein
MWRFGTGCPTGRGGGPSLPCNLTQTCWPTGRRTARRRRGDGAATARRRRGDGAATARRPSAPRENGRDSAAGHALLPQRPRAECAKENRECESARAESDGSDSAFRCFFCVAPRSRRARATVSAHAARTRDVCTRFTTRPRAQRDLALCNERANTRRTRLLASRSHTSSPTHTRARPRNVARSHLRSLRAGLLSTRRPKNTPRRACTRYTEHNRNRSSRSRSRTSVPRCECAGRRSSSRATWSRDTRPACQATVHAAGARHGRPLSSNLTQTSA